MGVKLSIINHFNLKYVISFIFDINFKYFYAIRKDFEFIIFPYFFKKNNSFKIY